MEMDQGSRSPNPSPRQRKRKFVIVGGPPVRHAQPPLSNQRNDMVSQFMDDSGREYRVLTEGQPLFDYVSRGDLPANVASNNPDAYLSANGPRVPSKECGPQLLSVRLQTRPEVRTIPDPQIDGGRFLLRHRTTQRQCEVTYEQFIWSTKGRNALLFCSAFRVLNEDEVI